MNLTPQEFLNGIISGKSEKELNEKEIPMIDQSKVAKMVRHYGHTAESAIAHLKTDYSNGFTICKHCGTFHQLGNGFTKHLSDGCIICEGERKHLKYWHKGNNEKNYKTEPRWMAQAFDDGMHYTFDKLQKNKYQDEVMLIEGWKSPAVAEQPSALYICINQSIKSIMKKKEEKPLTEKDLTDLTLGKRAASTDKEKSLQKQIEAIKKKGRIVEIPTDWT